MNFVTVVIAFTIVCGFCDIGVNGVAIHIDLRLTDKQKEIMDKFKAMMIPRLPHQYMHEEIYLVRWLRARDFDLKRSEEMLLANLKWRKQNKLDTIHLEDWSDMQRDYPHYLDGFDKRGQPIVTAIAREWDLRNAVVTGRSKRALRYMDKALDESQTQLRQLQLEGQNVTQFILILHLGHFNLYQHACPRCITNILAFLDSYENHFPGMADKILIVQTPPAFDTVIKLVREALSPVTKEAMTIYGQEPKIWKKVLRDLIDEDQLLEELGGTRPLPLPSG